MTDTEARWVRDLLQALQVGQWVNGRCPRCHYSQGRGHKCSCPVKLADRNLRRALGQSLAEIEDDDLLVANLLRELACGDPGDRGGRRLVVRAAVDAAVAFGSR